MLLVAVLTIRRPGRQRITHTGVSSAYRGVLLDVGTGRQVAPLAPGAPKEGAILATTARHVALGGSQGTLWT